MEPDYATVCVGNGLEALNILLDNGEKFSAVLLDILMPVMDGYEVMRVMQKTPGLSKMPVLVTSQAFEEEYELKALNMGASDFISKFPHIQLRNPAPIYPAAFPDSVSDLLQ